jgi:Pentapeptide repeats (8 copies)
MKKLWRRHSVRWLVLGAAGLLAAIFVLWILPIWLTERPHTAKEDRLTVINNARTGVVAFVVALGAVTGLLFTARTYRLSVIGHVTDRYTKAVEQLGSTQASVRVGGLYALERLAWDSPDDRPTIVEVVTAFVRERAPWPPHPPKSSFLRLVLTASAPPDAASPEVLAAVTVLRRRPSCSKEGPLDLAATNLAGVDLHDANLIGARLEGTNLSGTNLAGADLRESHLEGAVLHSATLHAARVGDASLYRDQETQLAGAHETDRVVWKDPAPPIRRLTGPTKG